MNNSSENQVVDDNNIDWAPLFIPFLFLFYSVTVTKLFKKYNPLARPSEGDEPVDVAFGMGLIQILQIVEVEQTVKVNVWLRFSW